MRRRWYVERCLVDFHARMRNEHRDINFRLEALSAEGWTVFSVVPIGDGLVALVTVYKDEEVTSAVA